MKYLKNSACLQPKSQVSAPAETRLNILLTPCTLQQGRLGHLHPPVTSPRTPYPNRQPNEVLPRPKSREARGNLAPNQPPSPSSDDVSTPSLHLPTSKCNRSGPERLRNLRDLPAADRLFVGMDYDPLWAIRHPTAMDRRPMMTRKSGPPMGKQRMFGTLEWRAISVLIVRWANTA
jgi:hypothetical protein